MQTRSRRTRNQQGVKLTILDFASSLSCRLSVCHCSHPTSSPHQPQRHNKYLIFFERSRCTGPFAVVRRRRKRNKLRPLPAQSPHIYHGFRMTRLRLMRGLVVLYLGLSAHEVLRLAHQSHHVFRHGVLRRQPGDGMNFLIVPSGLVHQSELIRAIAVLID